MSNDQKKIKILFASRLVLEKGIDIVLEAVEQISHHQLLSQGVEWTFCSDGEYSSHIEKLVEKYPDSVRYTGKVSPEHLADLYRAHDFLLMPSRFLETFGFTALESLACGTPVIGFRKAGLVPFIEEKYELDPTNPIHSLIEILLTYDISTDFIFSHRDKYSQSRWQEHLVEYFQGTGKIAIIHDYSDRIGGAEYYVHSLFAAFSNIRKQVSFFSYTKRTTPWIRRGLFIGSLFAFWRGLALEKFLQTERPDALWLHSILRYIGPWGIFAICRYIHKYPHTRIYLSHHDVGLIAPFPQSITEESQIPSSGSFFDFIPRELSVFRMIMGSIKWCYVALIKKLLPSTVEHIIFAPFLEKHITHHFSSQKIHIFPHTVDEGIFHP